MSATLRSKLKQVRPGEATLLSRLAGAMPLQPATAAAPGWIVLRADAGWEAWLAPLSGPEGPLSVAGDDGTPDALQAALALEAVEPLTAALERAWQTSLQPVRLERNPPGLRVEAAHVDCRVQVAVVADTAVSLPFAAHSFERVAAVSVPVEWWLAGPALSGERLGRLGSGDMILLPADVGVTLVSAQARWAARADLKARTAVFHEMGGELMVMSEQGWTEARTPIEVVIDGGAVTVGQLAALAPGAVLSLDLAGGVVPVTVRAGGVRIGSGELVAVGDVFGVVLSRVDLSSAPAEPTAADPVEA